MAPKLVRIPKPNPGSLDENRPLSPVLRETVSYFYGVESTLPSDQQTGIDVRAMKTEADAIAYVQGVTAKLLSMRRTPWSGGPVANFQSGVAVGVANTSVTSPLASTTEDPASDPPGQPASKWIAVVAAMFGFLTFLFFASLVVASLLGKSVPPDSRLLVVAVLAIGVALSASFLGGKASASGKLPLPWGVDPVSFSVVGGIAVFVIVFLVGYFAYVRTGDDAVTLAGTVLDADSSAGISGATVTIKTAANIFERPATDAGDFRVSDIPHLFNQQVTISAKAENYRPADAQTVLIASYVQNFKLQMHNCYNGKWHETVWPAGSQGMQWQFKVIGPNLHIYRMDGFVSGDFHRGADGNWTGQLSWENGDKTPGTLDAPNADCNQIVTTWSWSYARDTSQ